MIMIMRCFVIIYVLYMIICDYICLLIDIAYTQYAFCESIQPSQSFQLTGAGSCEPQTQDRVSTAWILCAAAGFLRCHTPQIQNTLLYHDSISTGSRLFMVFVSIQYCFLIWSRGPYKKKTGITAQHCHIKCTWALAVTPRFVFLPCFLKPKKVEELPDAKCHNLLHVTFRSRCYVYIIIRSYHMGFY